mgnify:CR=1 FL=1
MFIILGLYLTMPLLSLLAKKEYTKQLWFVVLLYFIFNAFLPNILELFKIQLNTNLTVQLGGYAIFIILGYLLSTQNINPKYRITTLELCGHALSKGVNINYISPDNKPAIAKVVNGLYPKLNNEFDPYKYTDGQINSIINGTLANVNMSWITPKISAMDMSTINMYLEKYPQLNKLDLQNIKPELLKLTIEFLTIGVNITEYTTKDTTIYELTTIGNALAEGVNLDMLKVENR